MGYIKEPDGVDFFVDSKPLTEKERKEISEIIANYQLTGRKNKTTSNVHKVTALGKQGTRQLEQ